MTDNNNKDKKSIKSSLRYPGGKTKLVKEIERFSPKTYREYREPFLGGGSYLLHVSQTQPSTVIKKASDTFYPLYNFWQHTICCPTTLITEINKQKNIIYRMQPNKKIFFNDMKKIIVDENKDLIERAAAFFIVNRTSFSGSTMSGGFSQASYDGRFKDNHINAIKECSNVLRQTQVRCSSYEELLFEDGEDVFIYLDPPYSLDDTFLYGNKGSTHKGFDHVKFANDCKRLKHKLLITYNDNEQIRKLFDFEGATINEVDVTYSMSKGNNKSKKELFITVGY